MDLLATILGDLIVAAAAIPLGYTLGFQRASMKAREAQDTEWDREHDITPEED